MGFVMNKFRFCNHLYDCIILPSGSYMRAYSVVPRNILSWKALQYDNMGNMIVQDFFILRSLLH